MPSFDIVSKLDTHELNNAIDQANREIGQRFDFKDSGAKFILSEKEVQLEAPSDFQLGQMRDILHDKMTKRHVDIRYIEFQDPVVNLAQAKQVGVIKAGLDSEMAKKIVKMIKAEKLKVQAAIQGDQVRVTGKKRDDLQCAINFLKGAEINLPLQYENFRE